MTGQRGCRCGFVTGDRVKMRSSFTNAQGESIGVVHGVVEDWDAGCGHIVAWELGTVTALPNPNVERVGAAHRGGGVT